MSTRRLAARLAAAALFAATACLFATRPAVADDELRRSLDATCRARMQNLAEIEAANLERIDWEVVPGGVRGVYVGYAPSFTCVRGAADNDPPTARFSYQEVVYERRGDSARAARQATPKPIEIRDVTVVLVHRDGRWW